MSDPVVTLKDVYDVVNRLETKMDTRLSTLDAEVDKVQSRLDRLEGAIGLVKWLGPSGVGAVLLGLIALVANRV